MGEFQDAGTKPGLQVWRMEKLKMTPVSTETYGTFFTGDAYLLLYTLPPSSYNIHLWHGKECSIDERGSLAIHGVQLDDHLGGLPVQYHETQGNESNVFMGYFRNGVTYKKGGVASGFRKVETNESDVRRLLHLKGRRRPRLTEEDLAWSSFTSDDCFIIDLGKDIYLWCGGTSNRYERLKGIGVANGIRDDERGGRSDVQIIDEGDEPDEVLAVLGPKPNLPAGSQSDASVDRASKRAAMLYKISDASGTMSETLVSQAAPFKQADLLLSECYLLDNKAGRRLFVWKGTTANPGERSAALTKAQKFIDEKKYPVDTQIEVLPAGAESTLFKQFFSDWRDKYETIGMGKTHTCSIAKVVQIPFDASTLHKNQEMAAQHNMVDDGSGEVKIWRVEDSERVEVDPSTYGQFFGGDCYLILYSYSLGCRKQHIIYIWQGLKCSQVELTASAFLSVVLDGEMGDTPVQVRVTQGEEPAHLVSLFKEKPMMLFLGGTSREGGQTVAASTRLFHIRCSSTGATRAVEVEASAASLNSNDVFVLKSADGLFQWRGAGSSSGELAAAKHVAAYLGGAPKEMKEGDESAAFWSALGGKKPYQTSKSLRDVFYSPRLFVCSNATGRLTAEELCGELTQIDLASDDVMILDTWLQIFLWIGTDANDVEKAGASEIADNYLLSDPSGRGKIPISTVKQGAEPPTFTGWFHPWDPKLWDNYLAKVH